MQYARLLSLSLFVAVLAGCTSQSDAQVVGGGGSDDGGAADDGSSAPDPFSGPSVCTSGKMWTGAESANMAPGEPCLGCHLTNNKRKFWFGGTVYPTGHEPNDCFGPSTMAGAQVVVTDSTGTDFTATVNSVGNFYVQQTGTFTPPFSAKVVKDGKTREMGTKQMDGDCNSCHTEHGKNLAPGRIVIPE
jgi:hypothetical protein